MITKSTNPKADIKALRDAGADVIVCCVSWGKMGKRDITSNQKTIMKVLVKAGVDVIIGYGPHCVQPAAWVDGEKDADGNVHRTLCLGATGNLLSDQYGQYDSGIIFQFTIQETEYGHFAVTNPIYVPTYVWRNETEDGRYDYRALAVGQWLESAPEGMAYADAARMRQIWADVQAVMGSEVAAVAAE